MMLRGGGILPPAPGGRELRDYADIANIPGHQNARSVDDPALPNMSLPCQRWN